MPHAQGTCHSTAGRRQVESRESLSGIGHLISVSGRQAALYLAARIRSGVGAFWEERQTSTRLEIAGPIPPRVVDQPQMVSSVPFVLEVHHGRRWGVARSKSRGSEPVSGAPTSAPSQSKPQWHRLLCKCKA